MSPRPGPLWRATTRGAPFFASARGGTRERSGSDVLILVVSVLAAAVLASVAVPPSGFEHALIHLIDAVPSALSVLWRLATAALLIWVVAVVGTAALRRRAEVLIDVVSSSVLAVAGGLGLARALNGDWPTVSQAVTGGSSGLVPLVVLCVGAAVAFAASPHLTQPYRRLGRLVVWTAAGATVLLGSTTPTGALLSLVLAGAAAAAVHLVLGSTAARPSLADVADALDQVGVAVEGLRSAERRDRGVDQAEGTVAGRPVLVKVHGRDARDTQLLARAWRRLWYRGATPTAWTRLQQVEHEGFVTLLARSRGCPVPDVVVAGRTDTNDALVVLSGTGAALGDELDEPSLEQLWRAVGSLHDAGMAHGAVSPEVFGRDDGRIVVSDLSTVTIAPSEDLRRSDLAQTLVTCALLAGIERAVVVAGRELGTDGVEQLLPYLQLPAMSTSVRRALKAAPFDLDALRSAAAAVVDVEVPHVVELRRVSPQTIVAIALLALVVFALVASLGDVDLAELADELRGATWSWVVVALFAAQLPFLSQAVATRGACPRPIAYGPLAVLQFAIGFVALAVPSTAGRLALDIRFFQRQGLPAATAVSISAIDGFSGFLVQISLLLATLAFGVGQVDLDLRLPTSSGSGDLVTLLVVAAAVTVVLVVVALSLPKVRQRIWARIGPMVGEALETVRSLRSLPKLVQLFGGNLANQLLFALALGACLMAFGERLNLATLVVVYVAAALFGGLMPVPGGIGVMEAALMAGLTAAGIDATTASATALLFRSATFYLPPIWGWFALRWLQRHSYL